MAFDARFSSQHNLPILFLSLRADFGGGPEHLWQLLRNAPSHVRPYVACPEDYPYYERFCECVGKDNIFILPHRRFSLHSLWCLRIFCREHGIALLHSHGKGAGLYARLLACLSALPCVHTFHGVHVKEYGPLKKFIYRQYEKSMALLTGAAISVSAGERDQILAEGLMPSEKLHLIENGVPIPSAIASFSADKPYRIVSFSRYDVQKNSLFLLKIMHTLRSMGRLEEFRFTLVGDGKERTELEKLAEDGSFADLLVCVGTSTEPHTFFEQALCYLSTSRWEGMPLAVLEAMAYGLPAVVTDVVGNRDVVSDRENGILYPEGDAGAAAAALCCLADDPVYRQTLGRQGRAYVETCHSAKKMAQATFELLEMSVRARC